MKPVFTMGSRERDRFKILVQVVAGTLTQSASARALDISERQVCRLTADTLRRVDGALVHGLRGKRPNRSRSVAAHKS